MQDPTSIVPADRKEAANRSTGLVTANYDSCTKEIAFVKEQLKKAKQRDDFEQCVKLKKNLDELLEARAKLPTPEPTVPKVPTEGSARPTTYNNADERAYYKTCYFSPAIPQKLQIVKYEELSNITGGFNDSHVIGEGAFGLVYRSMWRGQDSAVKVLHRAEDDSAAADFIREVMVLGTVAHANIVRLLGVSCDGPQRILMYEYMVGGSLDDLLAMAAEEVSHFSWNDRVRIMLDSCLGIACLHECSLVHCDIKPGNILLREDLSAAVGDFGLSRTMESQKLGNTMMAGTPGYADPDWWLTDKPTYTEASDIYALGVVFLQVLTGESIYCNSEDGRSALTLTERYNDHLYKGPEEMAKFVDTNADWPVQAAEAIASISLKCISIKRDDRPAVKGVLKELWTLTSREEYETEFDDRWKTSNMFEPSNEKVGVAAENAADWGARIRLRLERFEREKANHAEAEKRFRSRDSSGGELNKFLAHGAGNTEIMIRKELNIGYTQEGIRKSGKHESPQLSSLAEDE